MYIQDGKTPLDYAREEEEEEEEEKEEEKRKRKEGVVEYLQQQLGECTISTHTENLNEF